MHRTAFVSALIGGISLVAARPDVDFVGSTSVSPKSDGCWSNVTLHAKGRALVITTSHGEKLPNGKPTGVAVEEFTAPYYVYQDAGMDVDVASIQGGDVPLGESTPTPSQLRFMKDPSLKDKMKNSKKIDDVTFSDYDIVFMSGGLGASFDLGTSQILGGKVAAALESRKPLVGSTCHGALGFVLANKTDGTSWLKGMTVTGVTDDQAAKVGYKDQVPMHPEEVLRKMGANYLSIKGAGSLGDVGATSVAVDVQGPILVTGQNQNSACVAAQRQVLFLMDQQDEDEDTYTLVPTPDCKAPLQWCFNGYKADIELAYKTDIVDLCRYGNHFAMEKGRCQDKGFDRRMTVPIFGTILVDPIFKKLNIFFPHQDSLVV